MNEHLNKLSLPYKVLLGTLLLIMSAAGISSIISWYTPTQLVPPNTYVEALPQPKVGAVPKVAIEVKKVKVIPKGTAIKVINDLPSEVVADPNTEVTNTATTAPSKAGFDVVTTINKESGETKILVKEKSRSLVEFLNEKRIGVAYGVTTDKGQQFGTVFGEWTVLRVGNVHVGVHTAVKATFEGKAEGTFTAVADYRW